MSQALSSAFDHAYICTLCARGLLGTCTPSTKYYENTERERNKFLTGSYIEAYV